MSIPVKTKVRKNDADRSAKTKKKQESDEVLPPEDSVEESQGDVQGANEDGSREPAAMDGAGDNESSKSNVVETVSVLMGPLEMCVKLFVRTVDSTNALPLHGDARNRFEALRKMVK